MKNRYVLPRLRRYHDPSNPLFVITKLVSENYGITIEELINPGNSHKYSKRRHLFMVVLSRHTFIPHKTIGIFFGYRDHCMVSHANRFVENLEYIYKKTKISDPLLDEFNSIDLKFISFFLNPSNHE